MVTIGILLALGLIALRLAEWQIVRGEELRAKAESQYVRTVTNSGQRGTLFSSDGLPLVTNQQVYRLFAQPHLLKQSPSVVSQQIAEVISADSTQIDDMRSKLQVQLEKPVKWISLLSQLSSEEKDKIEQLNIYGLGFDHYQQRFYPEASLAAHVVGFVGKTSDGADTGYFGVEGALESEIKARGSRRQVLTDAVGRELIPNLIDTDILSGRDVYLTIRRDIQFLVERELADAIKEYGAESGEVIILEPATGKVIALAAYPNYDPGNFQEYDSKLYKNPTLTELYEPGSTLKALTVAAGIDTNKISPHTSCTRCAGPRTIGKYTIKTWNEEYNPNINMEEGLAKSDNTAMIFITDLVGRATFVEYLKRFGIGEPTGVELQEDVKSPFPQHIGPVELATLSFGQGIATNSFQVIKAISAIANQGKLLQPTVIEKIYDPATGESLETEPVEVRQVISPESAKTVTKMLVTAANSGEAQWTARDTYLVAGKTGTSQIAIKGGYDEERTIASFVGYAPAYNPEFVMLVKLVAPTTSPWAAETAAPLWYDIADKLRIALPRSPATR